MLAGSAAPVQASISNQCWQKASLKAAGVDRTVCASLRAPSLSLPCHTTFPFFFSSSLSLTSPLFFLLTKKPKLCLFQREHWTFSTNVQIENDLIIQFDSRIIFPLPFWMSHLLSLDLIQSLMLTGWLQSYTDGSFHPPETGQANDGTGRGVGSGMEGARLTCSVPSLPLIS